MTIKEIINTKDGNKIEALILERLQRHIFMLYSMKSLQNISIRLLISVDSERYANGIYVYIKSERIDFLMRLPEIIIIKMIAQEFYTPFHEENIKAYLKVFIDEVEEYKNLKTKGIEMRNSSDKVLLEVHFKQERHNFLIRLLEGLGLW